MSGWRALLEAPLLQIENPMYVEFKDTTHEMAGHPPDGVPKNQGRSCSWYS